MDVPITGDAGEIKGWKSITDRATLHDTVVQRNLGHLHQAAPTPMGHGEGYNLFHGPEQHKTAEAVLNGSLTWEHPVAEVNEFIANMKVAFDPVSLEEERAKINEDITPESFRHYFRHKSESTESSPSGRHIGHYKAILQNDDLVDLQVLRFVLFSNLKLIDVKSHNIL